MADNRKQFAPNSANFSDETIRRFLLGQLNADEQSIFEERLFSEDGLEARVRLGEFDLADDYSRRRLSRADHTNFRERFLVSADRKRTLEVSEALHSRFVSNAQPSVTVGQRLIRSFDIARPAWRYALAALILLLIFATVWRGIKEPRLVQQIIPKRAAPKPTATQTPREAQHSIATSTPGHAEQTPPLPAHEAISLTIVLNPKTTQPTIMNPPQNDNAVVRFQLMLDNNQPGPFRAELFSDNGELIFSADSLAVLDDSKINFDVPARVLKTGDQQIKLTRINDGSFEGVASYYVRVR